LLSLLASVAAAKDGILLVDELENGLHHTSMGILWRALVKGAVLNNVQVIATTHSYECIQSFKDNLVYDRNSDASVIRIERNGETHKAVTMNMGDLQTMFENNREIR
jgi:AAA15 family ATPase/GTPase